MVGKFQFTDAFDSKFITLPWWPFAIHTHTNTHTYTHAHDFFSGEWTGQIEIRDALRYTP